MLPVLEQCLAANDGKAWNEVLQLFHHATAASIRKVLILNGFGRHDAEDVVQDLWILLLDSDRKALRLFRGENRAQLAQWFRNLSVNFTLNWVHDRRAERKSVSMAFTRVEVADVSSLDEQELAALICDLQRVAGPNEILKLRILLALEPVEQPISERTLQRWRRQLYERLSKHFTRLPPK